MNGTIIDRKTLIEELCSARDGIIPAEYPEVCACLERYIETECDGADAYRIACEIRSADEGTVMSDSVYYLLIQIYEYEISKGNCDAMNDLGALYYFEKGHGSDFPKAMHYYEMAAENGSRQAQENLGYCYYYGRDIPVDYEKAYHFFILGALDGHVISLYKIGDMYLNGYYVKKNEKEAFCIYDRCAKLINDDEADRDAAGPVFLRLGNAFLYGKGTEKDPQTALICYHRAELELYDLIKKGNTMYIKSLDAAISGQEKARAILRKEI